MENKIELALKWFEDNDVSAYLDDGSIYVIAGRDADVQISTTEVDYRAELQKQFYDACKEVFKK
jgi:hypothetical protein